MPRIAFFIFLLLCTRVSLAAEDPEHQPYLDFFQEVYDTMKENYYLPPSEETYRAFLDKFKTKIYPELKAENKSDDYIRWRSAAYLVEDMRSEEDIFSAFYPPKPAREYEQVALGKRVDLGISGQLIGNGFVVTNVEPRSDAYVEGLRPRDVILAIDEAGVATLTQEAIEERLNPLEGTTVALTFLAIQEEQQKTIEVVSEEYFKQTVFMCPVEVPGVYCLKIERFNRKTSEDLLNYLVFIRKKNDDIGLVLDLRDNPGGPPLAAREISAFFLTPNEEFAYFQRRGHPKASLDVPEIPEVFHYQKPIVILVNEKSGSASELFSGVMQRKERAYVMGVNTAGQVMLKSMFNFDDESMLLLVTARGHFPDGGTFSFDGLEPDRTVKDDGELIRVAAEYLVSAGEKK